jgi:hypothetical protein
MRPSPRRSRRPSSLLLAGTPARPAPPAASRPLPSRAISAAPSAHSARSRSMEVDEGSTGCVTCPAGTHGSEQNSCITCPFGSFQPFAGQRGCTKCDSARDSAQPSVPIIAPRAPPWRSPGENAGSANCQLRGPGHVRGGGRRLHRRVCRRGVADRGEVRPPAQTEASAAAAARGTE